MENRNSYVWEAALSAGRRILTTTAFLAAGIVPALSADITLYEGDMCDQARLAHYDSRRNYDDHCKRRGSVCHKNNDEARSIKIRKSNGEPYYIALMDSDKDRLAPFSKVSDRSYVGYTLKINHTFQDDVLILIVNPRQLQADECIAIAGYGANYGMRKPGVNAQMFRRNGLAGKVSKVVIGR